MTLVPWLPHVFLVSWLINSLYALVVSERSSDGRWHNLSRTFSDSEGGLVEQVAWVFATWRQEKFSVNNKQLFIETQWSNNNIYTIYIYIYIYIWKLYRFLFDLATLVEGDPKVPFSIATTPRCRGGRHSIPWIAQVYPWSSPYSAVLSKAASSTIFWVFGITRPGIERWSPRPLANTLLIKPMALMNILYCHNVISTLVRY